ncbi:hypothetical protein CEXT_240981 [Caerostris extrusa]|uniref:Uncharacterized protein n=1 Tax=Caerostris extrusa TaxID=172846 RepID=A0AAV4PU07_CAEEX|nr:hypothetical protein CEXT_240981 [Caerostris extrusa]
MLTEEELNGGTSLMMKRVMYGFNLRSNRLTPQEPAGVNMYTIYIHFESRNKPLNSRPAVSTLRLITLITLLGREISGLKCNFPSASCWSKVTFKSRALSFRVLEHAKRVENADPYHFILALFGNTFASVCE